MAPGRPPGAWWRPPSPTLARVASPGGVDIQVEQLPAGGGLVRISGELDLATLPELERVVDGATLKPRLVVDLTECSFLDSSAVRVLLEAATKAEHAGGHMSLVAPDGGIRRILEIAGIDTLLPVHTTLGEAV
jgi:anti-anti-sigma factor